MIFCSRSCPALVTVALCAVATSATADAEVRFNRDIRPIMSDTCFHCHGPDAKARKANLRLDLREEALKPAKSGEIPIVPGKPDESEIIKRIFAKDEDDLMPPPDAHKTLTPAQKELFRHWVAEGAKYESHWAYVPLSKPAAPQVRFPIFEIRNPIDAFITEKLVEKSITPSKEADKRTLLRRLSLDLIGLPPTPEEMKAFLADKSGKAYERQVDRLLKSPHFGERWAVWWLDVARFTDTVGFHGDQPQRIFPYRDYVINAFNTNKRFDQFTLEQLAGDLLPNPTTEQLTATGFNRLNMVTREGGAQPKEYLAKYNAERVRTIGGAWLGATLGCCECHDHKFDPFTARDFYSMQSFFADMKQWGYYADAAYARNPELKGFGNEHPFPPEILVESPPLKRREAKLRAELADVVQAASKKLGADAKAKDTFAKWRKDSLKFFAANPTGWNTPAPAVSTAPATPPKPKTKAVAKEAGKKGTAKKDVAKGAAQLAKPAPPKFTIEADGRVVFLETAADNSTFKFQPPAGWLAAIRVELLPDAKHSNSIVRGGASNSISLKLTAALRAKDAKKDTLLAFRHADADRKEPRYKETEEIIGVRDMWKTREQACQRPHTGVWLLDAPVRVADGDVLSVQLSGNSAGCVRVSVSPFAPSEPLAADAMSSLRKALEAGSAKSRAQAYDVYLASTGWDADAFARYKVLAAQIRECRGAKAWTMVTQSVEPMTIRVLARGNWMDESGAIMSPATPAFLPGMASTRERRLTRLDFAKWLCSKENPLTARAVMNRLWKQFFGTGISAVVDDLGAQGEPPSHPELLDWIACEFRDSGWDVKHMIKLFAMSATYRQDSSLRQELRDIDPNNRLLASQNPRRLDAEFVRDNALFVAGLLNLEIGGPSVKPYQPADYYANLQFPTRDYVADRDDRQWRRGVYMHWQRTFLHPMLANFDAPMRDECAAARTASNTPQQALTLLNDPSFVEAARVFAQRL
ncbi:MAG TPA: PSD1 and planctomycete cytochrome C domain-containing protein, partial [Verrucomicrobiae bacterium]